VPEDGAGLALLDASEALRARSISSLELTRGLLARIDRLDETTRAYVTVTADDALAAAERADAEMRRSGLRSPVHGIPIAVKDLFDTRGIRTMANSRVWDDRVPRTTATAVRRLQDAGAVLLGKLQTSEFAIGAASEDDLRPPPRNPWAMDRSPGGSSSGSAVALAATLCLGSVGSDTGGSIRAPASHCGVVGLKPTFGRVSRHGMAMLSWSLDHAGPMGRRVGDVAALLTVIAGPDPNDRAAADVPVDDYVDALRHPVRSLSIGVPRRLIAGSRVEESVGAAFNAAIDVLTAAGAKVIDVEVPPLDALDAVFNPLLFGEAMAIHGNALKDGAPYGSGFRRRVLQGSLFSAVDYVQAQRGRTRLIREFSHLMRQVDVLATPTMGIAGPRLGTDPNAVRSPFTRIFNVTGQPSISVPCGVSHDRVPVGLMLPGRWFDVAALLRVASAFEAETSWHKQTPPILPATS
jgi:Asp-tRNA(Asn)/Glu-tRNA(Gln) amidotransferase A subunit family amidase